MIIAIDGPAGAGKSTIAQALAEALSFQLVDTGALYRAVAFEALQRNADLHSGVELAQIASHLELEFRIENGDNVLYCNEKPLKEAIRSAEVSRAASVVSAHSEVRNALLEMQRKLGRQRDSILEGRDIGTVVFPDADLKFFVTASAQIRAQRRLEQMKAQGMSATYEEVLAEIVARDERDSTREIAPLKCADDAHLIDTSQCTIEEVLNSMLEKIRTRASN